ncbi:hypothetical protein ABT294_17155, partial [Nonomuraea sp. NPDC000554]|uniref:hypothetical protein n=1 Tax=Nonomuraea sp. NPDC000554 TaxID=3154259 RepID=UPI0033229DD0
VAPVLRGARTRAVTITGAAARGAAFVAGAAARGLALLLAGTGAWAAGGVLRGAVAGRVALVAAEGEVQGVGTLPGVTRRVVGRRRPARPLRTGRAALPPLASGTSRRTPSGAGPSLRAGAA